MKTHERDDARRIRREEGRSIKDIARLLGVSSSSVSLWVRDIELTPAQHEALRGRNAMYDRQRMAHAAAMQKRRDVRLAAQLDGRERARRGEVIHVAGCMLFWAEGSRRRGQVRFTNSDPEMMRFFVNFLRICFNVEDGDLRVACHLYADHVEQQRQIEDFWLDALELPRTSLLKSMVNVYSKHSQRKRKNVLPYGTCRVTLSRTSVAQHIYGAIQEYGGFERDWLDMAP